MLLKLLIFRMGPLAVPGFLNERGKIKLAVGAAGILELFCFCGAVWQILVRERMMGVWMILLSCFPQHLCYAFSFWILFRCLWQMWSVRVWKRIYRLSLAIVFLGVLAEKYVNGFLLHLFFEFFKQK